MMLAPGSTTTVALSGDPAATRAGAAGAEAAAPEAAGGGATGVATGGVAAGGVAAEGAATIVGVVVHLVRDAEVRGVGTSRG